MKDKMFGMVSVSALCTDAVKPVITIPVMEESGEECYVDYEVHPISCTIAGYQPVRLISSVDEFQNIDVPDGVLNVNLVNEDIQLQFTWEKEWEEPWGEYETDMLNITYLF